MPQNLVEKRMDTEDAIEEAKKKNSNAYFEKSG